MFNATATPWIPTEYEDFCSVVGTILGTIEVYEQILEKSQARNSLKSLVPEAGVEPARPKGHGILSPARLPVPPLRHLERHYPTARGHVN